MLFSFMIRLALGVAAPILMQTYHISPQTMGYILSGWNWSITAGLLFSGPIVDRWGPWISMGVGSAIWGLSTIALPLASTAVSLFMMRLIFGVGQSALIPTTTISVSRGFSPKERATAIGIVLSGTIVGSAIGAALTAFIVARSGWAAAFYWLGGGSLLLTLFWFCFFFRTSGSEECRQYNRKPRSSKASITSHGFRFSAIARRGAFLWG